MNNHKITLFTSDNLHFKTKPCRAPVLSCSHFFQVVVCQGRERRFLPRAPLAFPMRSSRLSRARNPLSLPFLNAPHAGCQAPACLLVHAHAKFVLSRKPCRFGLSFIRESIPVISMWGTIFVPVQGAAAVLFLIRGSVISFSLPDRTMKSCKVVLAFAAVCRQNPMVRSFFFFQKKILEFLLICDFGNLWKFNG